MRREAEAGDGSHHEEALLEFLKTKRWFGDKGREIRGASLVDAIPVEWPNSTRPFSVARVRVETDSGDSVYQLFLNGSAENDTKRVEEVLDDPEFLRGLADVWMGGADFGHRDSRWVVESESSKPLVVPPSGKIRVVSGEQTNTSIILNDQAILKLYRKLEPGIHPDVEVTRFLTIERQFVHVPALLGTVRFEDRNGTTVAGMLQEFVTGAKDAWTYVVSQVRKAAEDNRSGDALDSEIRRLGAVTRALHEEMSTGTAGGDFDRRAATTSDLRAWIAAAEQTVTRAIKAVATALDAGRVPSERVRDCQAVVNDGAHVIGQMHEIGADVGHDLGALTRTHGDYHLGQVLRSAAGQFLVIDFEGEPARPLSERRARSSPLRDVAGMVRSFAYAAAVAAADLHHDQARRASQARSTFERMRKAFLAGYHEKERSHDLLPKAPANTERLCALFQLEKQFYELQYELDHRPDWIWVPLSDMPVLSAR